jgi:ketosteroid isomerase-like protein
MVSTQITEQDVADLVRRIDLAAKAFMRGEMEDYVGLVSHADDYTLLPPIGGSARHGFDSSPEALEQMKRTFTSGDAQVEVAQSYTSGNLVVLVLTERQHGIVAGMPEQDWSLRVTLVFRREAGQWRLVHRHADPLVNEITFQRLARLARGDAGS